MMLVQVSQTKKGGGRVRGRLVPGGDPGVAGAAAVAVLPPRERLPLQAEVALVQLVVGSLAS